MLPADVDDDDDDPYPDDDGSDNAFREPFFRPSRGGDAVLMLMLTMKVRRCSAGFEYPGRRSLWYVPLVAAGERSDGLREDFSGLEGGGGTSNPSRWGGCAE